MRGTLKIMMVCLAMVFCSTVFAAHIQNQAQPNSRAAQMQLGYQYFQAGEYAQALHWFTLAAKQGDLNAMSNIAMMYTYGQGVPKSYDKAYKLFSIAASKGNAHAEFGLGNVYSFGYGRPVDGKKALYWYKKAAVQQLPAAYFGIGSVYYHGTNVPVNKTRGIAYFTQAANRGDATAQYKLGAIYQTGGGGTTQYTCFLHVVQISLVEW